MAVDLADYIRRAAIARGIDPEIALRVARSEGGLSDPTRQSDVMRGGQREPSYGPFQLLIGGQNGFPAGMGNDALARGIDPRTPEGALKGIDFALDRAKAGGWGPWYGAKAQGITGMMGINGGGPISSQIAAKPSSGPITPGSMAPPLAPPTEITDRPIADIQAPAPLLPPSLGSSASNIASILGTMAPMQQQVPEPPPPVRGPSPEQANALANFLEILKQRVPQYG